MKPESGHFYTREGEPAHFVPRVRGGGQRPTTVVDARKFGYLPSPTNILRILHKPALVDWMVRQGVYAVVTAPDITGEGLDQKIERVLEKEKQQDEEAKIARDRGTDIHAAIEQCLIDISHRDHLGQLAPFVIPVLAEIGRLGRVVKTEAILVADRYAGKTDCIMENDLCYLVLDFKTCKKVPDRGPWPEHKLQAAAYAAALGNTGSKWIQCAIIYISTTDPGKFRLYLWEDWQGDFKAFDHLVSYYYLANNLKEPESIAKSRTQLPF